LERVNEMSLQKELTDLLEKMESRYRELESLMADPSVASDPEQMKSIGKEFSGLERYHSLFNRYTAADSELEKLRADLEAETDGEMQELYEKEIDAIEERLAGLEEEISELVYGGGEEEKRPAIMEIRQGTGGDEASLFAGDLHRMYTRFAENMGWEIDSLGASPTSRGGFKEVAFAVKGKGAYDWLKYESGVHRVQRVPVTEASGRIHTSAATVAVLIEPDEVEVEIDPGDIKIDTFRAAGAGGQHVNKTDSAIRITHEPTGIVVECQDERSQHQNKAKAMRLLRARLLDALEREQQEKISAQRRSQVGSGDRSQRIRTYNFPQNRISDHRISLTLYKLEEIMQGSLELLLEPLIQQMRTREVENGGEGGSP